VFSSLIRFFLDNSSRLCKGEDLSLGVGILEPSMFFGPIEYALIRFFVWRFLIGVILILCVGQYSRENNSVIMSDKDEQSLTRCGNDVCMDAYGIVFRTGFSLRELNWAMGTIRAPYSAAALLDRMRFRALDELLYQIESVFLGLEDDFPLRKVKGCGRYSRLFRRGHKLVRFTRCVLDFLKNKQWQMPINCSCELPEEDAVSEGN
jgi:hypothetical protein